MLAALAVVGSTGWTAADAAREHGQLDVTALAIASDGDRAAVEDGFDVGRLSGHLVDSNVVAAANTTCDGCSSRATTLGVVYVNHGERIVVDNLATAATSGCATCSSVAVSAQVVVLRRADAVVANNRSLAVNAVCGSCRASAAAYQFVVVSPKGRGLTADDVEFLRSWVQTQADEISSGTAAGPEAAPAAGASLRSARPSTSGIESELRSRLGPGATVTAKVDVRRG